jgi:tripeptide aminopeptidase
MKKEQARSMINEERLFRTFTEIARISSPSWKEHRVIEWIIDYFAGLEVQIEKIPCGDSFNLMARIPGTKQDLEPIMFAAHTDTVTPCDNVVVVETDELFKTDGTTILGSDNKAAIVAMLEAYRVIIEQDLDHPPVEFLFTCAEEIGLQGIKGMDFSRIRSNKAFAMDSSGPVGRSIIRAPWHLTATIRVHGTAAHAGLEPENGTNAIKALAEIITGIPSGRIDNETTANVGMISGGQATNIVAEKAECHIEIRSLIEEKMNRIYEEVATLVRQKGEEPGLKTEIIPALEYKGYSIPKDDPLNHMFKKAIKSIGKEPQFVSAGGGSDTNILNERGIRAVNLSIGMSKVHTTDEYIMKADLVNATRIVLGIITDLAAI